MTMSTVFPSIASLYTQYRKIFSYFLQNSGAFITFNLSETLEGRLLGERRLLKEIRYYIMVKMTQFVVQCQLAGLEIPSSAGWSSLLLPTTADQCCYIPSCFMI